MDTTETSVSSVEPTQDGGYSQREIDDVEDKEWMESLDYVLESQGAERVGQLLARLGVHAHQRGVRLPFTANTPYTNTIPPDEQAPYPGSREIERRIKSLIRWNAMAMVVRANMEFDGIGGHISTYASAATLYEVAFNHFFRGKDRKNGGDMVYFQGHASPGIYARAFLEGRLTEEQLDHFRREAGGRGMSSYPHPWLMPNFWEFPTVSMGLGPIMAIYQARFQKYLENRGLKPKDDRKVWAFLGDGETDEPECLGSITLAAREKLDNLIFVINCNLQRLDGPVRGNGKIIQELEAIFRGAGWNVIKVIWGDDWDDLFARDKTGLLVKRAGEVVDGEYQKYTVESGAYIREHFFAPEPRLMELVKHLSDEQLQKMRRGGHDPVKVHAAYKAAIEKNGGRPTVILAKTIKGYGLGEAGEGRNVTHQQKKLNEEELRRFRTRFGIPISDEEVARAPFYRPPDDSPEMKYLLERRKALGGFLPDRRVNCHKLQAPSEAVIGEFLRGSADRPFSTTMAFVRLLARLLKDPELGKFVVPIVPDEARTFGMEALFRQCGIYSSVGQLYDPVDSDSLLYYKESRDGQILEEGITEAGSLSSFIAAGTAYATHGIPTIPFFIFYSMFGFQRIGDLMWAAGDIRTRGFLVGATSGRTTLNGEGLQHQDGHSQLLAYPLPNLLAYDPAFSYELAVIIQDGIRRMYTELENVFYYITVTNENYVHPPIPEGAEQGILKGLYRFRKSELTDARHHAQLLGSGAILRQVLQAQEMLEGFGVAADVWSVTSYKELRRDAKSVDRWNMLHPDQDPRVPYVSECLNDTFGPVVAASDYVKLLSHSLSPWVDRPITALGTDGFGRSDTREALRDFFEIDGRFITVATLAALARDGELEPAVITRAMKDLGIDSEKFDPLTV
ncbi:MAG: pyruvate dehydrogenase (acetyl-transferring), homodimeric type [Armatimonadetes bacterium]|nr:pyruvate dehydrogenase (acetyl-transferring), homodimeric type [Armatimonadota bacterium]